MADLLAEIDRFRTWADAYPGQRHGEWECDYPAWGSLYASVLEFIALRPLADWSAGQTEAVLYALARDNEMQHLAQEIRTRHPATLLGLAVVAVKAGEPDANWQLAEELGHLPPRNPEAGRILLDLADDEDEYVRRRALMGLARHGSPVVEELALREWRRPHEHQQWLRMAVLWSLHRIGSRLLPELLAEAEQDPRPYLRDFAGRVQQGRVAP